MGTLIRILAGGLLVAHGLVHLLYIAEDEKAFAFESWVIPESAARPVGTTLMWATVGAFALVGLAVWSLPGLSTAWPALTVAASAVSLLLLGLYFDVQVLIGVALDVALLAVVVIRPEWTQQIAG